MLGPTAICTEPCNPPQRRCMRVTGIHSSCSGEGRAYVYTPQFSMVKCKASIYSSGTSRSPSSICKRTPAYQRGMLSKYLQK
eukprot:scaffold541871_cov26-Prasinocladus_malaysianus.AAC.1